jgi:hypothetical protein
MLTHIQDHLETLQKKLTAQDLTAENQKIEIDEETGEVVMRFKLPGMGAQEQ